MAVWMKKEELEEMLKAVEKEMPDFEELHQLLRKQIADLPIYEANKAKQFKLFSKLCPNRCGKIDFEKNTVEYNTEKYTEWHSDFDIESIEDYIKKFDKVGLDYEIRIADIYDISKTFSVFFANTEEDNDKYRLALELPSMYSDPVEELKFEDVQTKNGIRKKCHARMDKENFEMLKVKGFNLFEIDIKPEKFQGEFEIKCEDGREIYYMDFFLDEK